MTNDIFVFYYVSVDDDKRANHYYLNNIVTDLTKILAVLIRTYIITVNFITSKVSISDRNKPQIILL